MIAPVGTRPPQRMQAVLLISTGSLSSHRFPSSIDGSSAPCFNSTLLGDTMATAWVQKNARWDGFPSSQFGQINSPKRKTLGTSFSLFKFPLKFSDRMKDRIGDQRGGNEWEPIKILSQKNSAYIPIATPRVTHEQVESHTNLSRDLRNKS
jgi:hypothetical protein